MATAQSVKVLPTSFSKDVRISLSVPAHQEALIDNLGIAFGQKSRPKTFELALTVLSWLESELRNERKIGSLSQDGANFRELAIPGYVYPVAKSGSAATPTKKE